MLPQCLDHFAPAVQRLSGETLSGPTGCCSHQLVRHPVGVVVGFLAWNFSLLNLGDKLGPALAAGCTGILKPSSLTSLTTALVGEVLRDLAFPPGVVNLVLGDDRGRARRCSPTGSASAPPADSEGRVLTRLLDHGDPP
ncbi:MAG: aldehyde dehydrogenase family protein [Fimbriimonadaceae bacterium]|nr:aldehyde dehydrogenase family protein [Fimbriimonadaceae bacterium]